MASRVIFFWGYQLICTVSLCIIFQMGFLRKAKKMTPRHLISVSIFLFYLMNVYMRTGIGTLWDLLNPAMVIRGDEINLFPFFVPSEEFGINLFDVLNVLMLIPLGFMLPAIWPSFRSIKKVALTGFLFSLSIEISQLFNHRITDINDLIMNTAGAAIGYFIYKLLYKNSKEIQEPSSPLVKHEAIFYLILSFLGIFLFFSMPKRLMIIN